MRYFLLFALVLFIFTGTVHAQMEKAPDYEEISESQDEEGEVKALDLGEPTPDEVSQMEREEENTRVEESGFSEAYDDTTQEMAGDESNANWEFNLD